MYIHAHVNFQALYAAGQWVALMIVLLPLRHESAEGYPRGVAAPA
jgi:hypothetical protein